MRPLIQIDRPLIVIVFLSLATCLGNSIFAQSNFDLLPPIQADVNSNEVLISPDPVAVPTFEFAVASLDENGNVLIATAGADQELTAGPPKPDPTMEAYTEQVMQNYTVMIPVTETVDGKQVVKMKSETRTRTVPITRMRKKKLSEEELAKIKAAKEKAVREGKADDVTRKERVTMEFVVEVPTTQTINGVKRTVIVPQKQARIMSVTRGTTITTRDDSTESFEIEEVKCFSIDGNPIKSEKFKKRLADKTPVILIQSEKSIAPYFQAILQPDAIFMVRPK